MTLVPRSIPREALSVGRPRSMTEDQIRDALFQAEGNVSDAARILGIERTALSEALRTWAKGIPRPTRLGRGRVAQVQLDKALVLEKWKESGGNISAFARLLNIDRTSTAYRHLHEAGVNEPRRPGQR